MSSLFTNHVLIVTGAASGIGREVALQAANAGAAVIATDNNITALEETRQLCLQQGSSITVYPLDVADKTAILDFAGEIIPTLGGRRLVLVNNAGVGLF